MCDFWRSLHMPRQPRHPPRETSTPKTPESLRRRKPWFEQSPGKQKTRPAEGQAGFPCTSCLNFSSGAKGTRTPDPLHAMQVRYQLRHSPIVSSDSDSSAPVKHVYLKPISSPNANRPYVT